MNYTPLPATLKVGDKIVQRKYAPLEILEVFKVDGNNVMLITEDGNRKFHEPLTVDRLKSYDYQLITEGTTP